MSNSNLAKEELVKSKVDVEITSDKEENRGGEEDDKKGEDVGWIALHRILAKVLKGEEVGEGEEEEEEKKEETFEGE